MFQMLSAASFSPTTFCEASIPVALLHLFSCNCFSPAVDAEISRSRWSAPWIHVFLPLLLRNIVFHRGLHPPRRVAFLICDSLSAFFFMAMAEARRDKEGKLSHLYNSGTPGLGPLPLQQHNYDISRPVVKFPFLSARTATRVFSLHFGEMKRGKFRAQFCELASEKRTWTARKAPPCSDWWIKLRQQLLTRKTMKRRPCKSNYFQCGLY